MHWKALGKAFCLTSLTQDSLPTTPALERRVSYTRDSCLAWFEGRPSTFCSSATSTVLFTLNIAFSDKAKKPHPCSLSWQYLILTAHSVHFMQYATLWLMRYLHRRAIYSKLHGNKSKGKCHEQISQLLKWRKVCLIKCVVLYPDAD